jgi:hypothetical protein
VEVRVALAQVGQRRWAKAARAALLERRARARARVVPALVEPRVNRPREQAESLQLAAAAWVDAAVAATRVAVAVAQVAAAAAWVAQLAATNPTQIAR